MRLTKLLLGSAAIVFAGGAAQAANLNPPLVETATVNAVEKCGPTNGGWMKVGGAFDWCLTFNGAANFTTSFGMKFDTESADDFPTQPESPGFFGDTPADATVIPIGQNGWSGYDLSTWLGLVASTMTPAGPLVIGIPIVAGGGTANSEFLTIGHWTFTDSSITWARAIGMVNVSIKLSEPATLDGDEARWPQVDVSLGFGGSSDPVQFVWTAFVGQRDWAQDSTLPFEMAYGTTATLNLRGDTISARLNAYFEHKFDDGYAGIAPGSLGPVAGIGEYNAWGAGIFPSFDLGRASIDLGARIDHMVLDPLGARALGNAFGFFGAVSFDVTDRLSFNIRGDVGLGNGMYTGYHYRDQPLGTYWKVSGGWTFEINDAWSYKLTAAWDQGPVAGDGVLAINSTLTFNPFGNLEATFGVNHTRTETGLGATNASIGVKVGF